MSHTQLMIHGPFKKHSGLVQGEVQHVPSGPSGPSGRRASRLALVPIGPAFGEGEGKIDRELLCGAENDGFLRCLFIEYHGFPKHLPMVLTCFNNPLKRATAENGPEKSFEKMPGSTKDLTIRTWERVNQINK